MNATDSTDALRWLHYEADRCRGRDACEALCLLLPALTQALDLAPMGDAEARAFRERVKNSLPERSLKKAA